MSEPYFEQDFVEYTERRKQHKVLFFKSMRVEKCICGYRPASYVGNDSDDTILESLMLSHFESFYLTKEDF